MTRPISKVLQEIREAKVRASVDLEEVPYNTRPGMAMSVRQAQDSLKALDTEYAAYVKAHAFTIYPTGKNVEEYAALAAVEGDTINVSARNLYETVSKDIEESLGGRRLFGVTQLTMLLNGLTEIGRELDLINLPIPQLEDVPHLVDFDALVDYVRDITRKAMGDKVQVPYMERLVTNLAKDREYDLSRIPVVVTGASEAEQESLSKLLFSGKGFIVNTDKGATKETVHQSFKTINSQLKKS